MAREIINEINTYEVLDVANTELLNRIGVWLSDGSGWVIESIDNLEIVIMEHKPLRNPSYYPLPKKSPNKKKATINITNMKDNKCFLWWHLAYLFPVNKKPQQITKCKEHIKKVNDDGIGFPVEIADITKIEDQNNIPFNVFCCDK